MKFSNNLVDDIKVMVIIYLLGLDMMEYENGMERTGKQRKETPRNRMKYTV